MTVWQPTDEQWEIHRTSNSIICCRHPEDYPRDLYYPCVWVFLRVCACVRTHAHACLCVCVLTLLTWQLREKKSWHETPWSITVWYPMTFAAVQHTHMHTPSPTPHTHTHSILPLSSQLYWIEEPLMENSRKEKDLPSYLNIIQW